MYCLNSVFKICINIGRTNNKQVALSSPIYFGSNCLNIRFHVFIFIYKIHPKSVRLNISKLTLGKYNINFTLFFTKEHYCF